MEKIAKESWNYAALPGGSHPSVTLSRRRKLYEIANRLLGCCACCYSGAVGDRSPRKRRAERPYLDEAGEPSRNEQPFVIGMQQMRTTSDLEVAHIMEPQLHVYRNPLPPLSCSDPLSLRPSTAITSSNFHLTIQNPYFTMDGSHPGCTCPYLRDETHWHSLAQCSCPHEDLHAHYKTQNIENIVAMLPTRETDILDDLVDSSTDSEISGEFSEEMSSSHIVTIHRASKDGNDLRSQRQISDEDVPISTLISKSGWLADFDGRQNSFRNISASYSTNGSKAFLRRDSSERNNRTETEFSPPTVEPLCINQSEQYCNFLGKYPQNNADSHLRSKQVTTYPFRTTYFAPNYLLNLDLETKSNPNTKIIFPQPELGSSESSIKAIDVFDFHTENYEPISATAMKKNSVNQPDYETNPPPSYENKGIKGEKIDLSTALVKSPGSSAKSSPKEENKQNEVNSDPLIRFSQHGSEQSSKGMKEDNNSFMGQVSPPFVRQAYANYVNEKTNFSQLGERCKNPKIEANSSLSYSNSNLIISSDSVLPQQDSKTASSNKDDMEYLGKLGFLADLKESSVTMEVNDGEQESKASSSLESSVVDSSIDETAVGQDLDGTMTLNESLNLTTNIDVSCGGFIQAGTRVENNDSSTPATYERFKPSLAIPPTYGQPPPSEAKVDGEKAESKDLFKVVEDIVDSNGRQSPLPQVDPHMRARWRWALLSQNRDLVSFKVKSSSLAEVVFQS